MGTPPGANPAQPLEPHPTRIAIMHHVSTLPGKDLAALHELMAVETVNQQRLEFLG
jgi:hypothetical protein